MYGCEFCKLVLAVPSSATTNVVLGELGRFQLWVSTVSCSAVLGQVLCRGSYGSNGSIKMMAKHKYRSWYMKIHAIISKHGFGCIVVGEVNQGGSLTLSG